jgi:hypothetical protein
MAAPSTNYASALERALSRGNGATTAKAATSLRVKVPSSGKLEKSVVVMTGRTPRTLQSA